jgi:hypothetical protein
MSPASWHKGASEATTQRPQVPQGLYPSGIQKRQGRGDAGVRHEMSALEFIIA